MERREVDKPRSFELNEDGRCPHCGRPKESILGPIVLVALCLALAVVVGMVTK